MYLMFNLGEEKNMQTKGLLLLSKREIRNPKAVEFKYKNDNSRPILFGRGYLKAEVSGV